MGNLVEKEKYCARLAMYCDFCGNKLPYNVRYCSKCGRQRRDQTGDTQPIPTIDETMLASTNNRQALVAAPWYKVIFKKKTPTNGSKVWGVMYYLASVAIIAAVIYTLATFKTVKEYQMLTSVVGSLLALYILWKR